MPIPDGIESSEKPRLIDQVRRTIRAHRFSPRTEEAYVGWIRRYVAFHGKTAQLDGQAIASFLSHLANDHILALQDHPYRALASTRRSEQTP
jgi:integrase-like protein